jgi:glycerol kinase
LTGLPVSPYFSLFKLIWLTEMIPEIKERIASGKIKVGTVDTWLIYNLTGKYVTDASNASRTYLCNLNGTWDESLLKLFKFKKELFP